MKFTVLLAFVELALAKVLSFTAQTYVPFGVTWDSPAGGDGFLISSAATGAVGRLQVTYAATGYVFTSTWNPTWFSAKFPGYGAYGVRVTVTDHRLAILYGHPFSSLTTGQNGGSTGNNAPGASAILGVYLYNTGSSTWVAQYQPQRILNSTIPPSPAGLYYQWRTSSFPYDVDIDVNGYLWSDAFNPWYWTRSINSPSTPPSQDGTMNQCAAFSGGPNCTLSYAPASCSASASPASCVLPGMTAVGITPAGTYLLAFADRTTNQLSRVVEGPGSPYTYVSVSPALNFGIGSFVLTGSGKTSMVVIGYPDATNNANGVNRVVVLSSSDDWVTATVTSDKTWATGTLQYQVPTGLFLTKAVADQIPGVGLVWGLATSPTSDTHALVSIVGNLPVCADPNPTRICVTSVATGCTGSSTCFALNNGDGTGAIPNRDLVVPSGTQITLGSDGTVSFFTVNTMANGGGTTLGGITPALPTSTFTVSTTLYYFQSQQGNGGGRICADACPVPAPAPAGSPAAAPAPVAAPAAACGGDLQPCCPAGTNGLGYANCPTASVQICYGNVGPAPGTCNVPAPAPRPVPRPSNAPALPTSSTRATSSTNSPGPTSGPSGPSTTTGGSTSSTGTSGTSGTSGSGDANSGYFFGLF